MTQNHRKPLDLQDPIELVPVPAGVGTYAFVNPKRSRKNVAVIVDAAPALEFDDVPTRDIAVARGTSPHVGIEAAIARADIEVHEDIRPTLEFRTRPAYRDPELCSCAKLTEAFLSKLVMVVVGGPVTLSPSLLREEMSLHGDFAVDCLEKVYDGKPWAFRHCPFNGCLIDEQVEIVPQEDPMTCCGTMALAVEYERVELPDPRRFDRGFAKFLDVSRASVLFTYCPWCATEIIDLVIARHKRHLGL
jgi:hypothetical protein